MDWEIMHTHYNTSVLIVVWKPSKNLNYFPSFVSSEYFLIQS